MQLREIYLAAVILHLRHAVKIYATPRWNLRVNKASYTPVTWEYSDVFFFLFLSPARSLFILNADRDDINFMNCRVNQETRKIDILVWRMRAKSVYKSTDQRTFLNQSDWEIYDFGIACDFNHRVREICPDRIFPRDW